MGNFKSNVAKNSFSENFDLDSLASKSAIYAPNYTAHNQLPPLINYTLYLVTKQGKRITFHFQIQNHQTFHQKAALLNKTDYLLKNHHPETGLRETIKTHTNVTYA